MNGNNQSNTVWVQRTDELPICGDCIFYNCITQKCSVRKNEQTSALHPVSCNFYQSQMMGE
jgi:hypothetical protein